MSQTRSKLKVYYDEAKERQTSHWDLDYLPAEEFEALMSAQCERREAALKRRGRKRLAFALGIGAAALLLLLALTPSFGAPYLASQGVATDTHLSGRSL